MGCFINGKTAENQVKKLPALTIPDFRASLGASKKEVQMQTDTLRMRFKHFAVFMGFVPGIDVAWTKDSSLPVLPEGARLNRLHLQGLGSEDSTGYWTVFYSITDLNNKKHELSRTLRQSVKSFREDVIAARITCSETHLVATPGPYPAVGLTRMVYGVRQPFS